MGGFFMKPGRIREHPILGPLAASSAEISFTFDGAPFSALPGESIAAALLAEGVRRLRDHEASGTPRGIYCNIGHCMECRVTVNGITGVRACLTPVAEGMDVRSGWRLPAPFGHSPDKEQGRAEGTKGWTR